MSTQPLFFLCRVWAEWCAGQFGESLRDQLSAEMELNSLASTLVHFLHTRVSEGPLLIVLCVIAVALDCRLVLLHG